MTRMPKREKLAPATFDREAFLCYLEGASLEGTAEVRAQSLSGTITRTNHRGRLPVYWRNKEIAGIRKEYLHAMRLHQRAIRGPLYDELTIRYE